jgi:hypothetical protein
MHGMVPYMITSTLCIIGICGRKRHGKDSVGRILRDINGFQLTAFADPVKRVAMDVYGLSWEQCYGDGPEKERIDPNWDLSPRVIMQRIGTEVGRSIHPDTWIKHTLNNIRSAADGAGFVERDDIGRRFNRIPPPVASTLWVVTDVRFPNEADAIRAIGGCVVKVVRPSLGVSTDEHPSETSVDLIEADVNIINDGTLNDLRDQVTEALNLHTVESVSARFYDPHWRRR